MPTPGGHPSGNPHGPLYASTRLPRHIPELRNARQARLRDVTARQLATAQAGRTHNANAGTQGGRHIARDFNGLGAAVKVLKHKLGLP